LPVFSGKALPRIKKEIAIAINHYLKIALANKMKSKKMNNGKSLREITESNFEK